jgi:hypothetical protein
VEESSKGVWHGLMYGVKLSQVVVCGMILSFRTMCGYPISLKGWRDKKCDVGSVQQGFIKQSSSGCGSRL